MIQATLEITAEEKRAAGELAERFMNRLDETGDIEPLINEMFAGDFMQRYIKRKQHELLVNKERSSEIISFPV